MSDFELALSKETREGLARAKHRAAGPCNDLSCILCYHSQGDPSPSALLHSLQEGHEPKEGHEPRRRRRTHF